MPPAEVTLAPAVFSKIPSKRRPRRVIGDKGYDCDALRAWFQKEYGVELIAPNRLGYPLARMTRDLILAIDQGTTGPDRRRAIAPRRPRTDPAVSRDAYSPGPQGPFISPF